MPTAQHGRTTKGRLQQQRNLSGGSSRVGLHQLQLTQKDPAQPKHQQFKRAGHSAVEVNPQRNTSPFPRGGHLNVDSRVQSREKVLTQKRATSAASAKRQQLSQAQPQKQKAGFSIARSDETDDDESEWVSSESGAVTPQNDVDGRDDAGRGGTPVERQPAVALAPPEHTHTHMNGDADRRVVAVTGLERVETARPLQAVQQHQPQGVPPPVIRMESSTPTPPLPPPATAAHAPAFSERPIVQPIRHSRSEAPSPTHLKTAPKRHPLVRQLSSHAESKNEMVTPHPLFRGQSRHSSLKPTTLAPLTVNPETVKAQLLASPVSGGVSTDGSPSYATQSFRLRTPSDASTESRDRLPSPKGSISSSHSVATLPAPSTARLGLRSGVDRARTLSVISNSSSSAALNALNMLPAMSRPATPPLTVHFPSESRRDVHDAGHHQLLPPNCAAAHITMLSRHNPLYESYSRVMHAKNRR